jgi:hypothetical protein
MEQYMNDLHSALLAPGDKRELVTALAAASGIDIPAEHVPEVSVHLAIAAAMARTVFAAPVTSESAQAPVYVPQATLLDAQGAAL